MLIAIERRRRRGGSLGASILMGSEASPALAVSLRDMTAATNAAAGGYSGPLSGLPGYSYNAPTQYVRDRNGVYTPSTSLQTEYVGGVAQGALIEPASSNGVRNPRGEGAVAGAPGTLPTYWATYLGGGLNRQVVGAGTENGLPYVDIRLYGTAASTNGSAVYFDASNGITGLTGQTWTCSVFVSVVGGSEANLNVLRLGLLEYQSNGTTQTMVDSGPNIKPAGDAQMRRTYTVATSGVGTAYLRPYVEIAYNAGAVVDITLRIAAPQMEQMLYATSPILPPPGTLAVSTRAAITPVITLPAAMRGASSYSVYAEWGGWANTANGARVVHMHSAAAPTMDRIAVIHAAGGTQDRWFASIGGAVQADNYIPNAGSGVGGRLAGRANANDFQSAVNGVLGVADTSGAVPPNLDTVILGQNPDLVMDNALGGYLRRILIVAGRAFDNTELITQRPS